MCDIILISTCTFPFHDLLSHYVVGIRLFNLAPVRNTVIIYNSWLLLNLTVQPLIFPIASKLTIEKTSTSYITNQYLVSSSANPYQGNGHSNGYSNVYVFSLGSS